MAAVSEYTKLQLASNTSQRVIALGVVLAICYFAQAVVITFVVSMLCAFLLEPVVGWLVGLRIPRGLAALLVCLMAVGLIVVTGGLFYSRSVAFVAELPGYESAIRQIVENVSQRGQRLEETFKRFVPQQQQQKIVQVIEPRRPRVRAPAPPLPPPVQEVRLKEDSGFLTKYVLPQLKVFSQFLLYASFIPFLVYFMLSWKDHVRHGFVNLFRLENRQVVHKTLNGISVIVRAFIVGNFLLGILLAILNCLVFWYLRIPFPLMMGSLSGFFSLIPYVGLPLAVIPPVFAALGVYKSTTAYLIIISYVAIVYVLAQNVLYPKVVGARVHLNPLAVTLAILVWSWMWGAIGLFLAIPITAGLKAVCDNVPSLRRLGEVLGD